jgi:hypothetical protein
MIKRVHLQLALILLAAIFLTLVKIPLASSQGLQLVAGQTQEDLPVSDPDAQLWQQATPVEVPLSAQNVSKPFLLNSKIKSVTARALANDRQLAVLVAWADDTENDSTVAVQDFRDAVALQYPLSQGQPFFCMGQQGGDVNIWHWKADWQADILARQEMEDRYPDMYVDNYPFAPATDDQVASAKDYTDPNYLPALAAGNLLARLEITTPVEDLVAGGFGSLTSQPADGQNVAGFGAWKDGQWRVIFSRDLKSTETDDVSFSPGQTYSIAFAAWDGANGERNGQKSTSQWINLVLKTAPAPAAAPQQTAAPAEGLLNTQTLTNILLAAFALIVIIIILVALRLPA